MATRPGSILLLSDVHAHYHVIAEQLVHCESLGHVVSQVLVLGDFGIFSANLRDYFGRGEGRFTSPVAFIEGNHEDFVAFDRLVRQYADVVTHLPRTSIHRFGAWRWLCVGGARYMDAWSTPRGCEITPADIEACLIHEPGSIEIVISHDCPTGIGVSSRDQMTHLGEPGDAGLARVARHLKPQWWFFGHHHRWHDSSREGTRFIGLPESWRGYAVLGPNAALERVEHEVALPRRPSWWKWIGLK